jgi:nucleotide-binding universal stress UspA family protein
MKKIILLFNGISAPWHITTFALHAARQSNAELHALFLRDERIDVTYPGDLESTEINLLVGNKEIENEGLRERNIELFKAFCDDEKITAHFETDISFEQLIDISASAEVMVADTHDNFQRYSLRDILAGVKCPVCLISVNATEIKKTILLFDGSEDAFYAITAYNSLFPKLSEEKSYLVTINAGEKVEEEDKKASMQNLGHKFPNLEKVSLSGNLEKKLIEFLDEHTENAMVVMGAYGRSAISRLFNPSLSNVILEQSRTSVFIAHDK